MTSAVKQSPHTLPRPPPGQPLAKVYMRAHHIEYRIGGHCAGIK